MPWAWIGSISCTLRSSWKVNVGNLAPVPSSAPSDSLLHNVSWLDSVYSSPYSLDVHQLFGTLKVGDVSRVHVFQTRSSLELRDGKRDKHTNYLLIKPNPWPHLIDLHRRGRQHELHRSVDLHPGPEKHLGRKKTRKTTFSSCRQGWV